MKKLLYAISLVICAASICVRSKAVSLAWNMPTNFVTTDLCFVVRMTPVLGAPYTNWPVFTNVSTTNFTLTADATGTNWAYVLSISSVFSNGPAQSFWVVQPSNFWGFFTNQSTIVSTPPAPPALTNLLLQKNP